MSKFTAGAAVARSVGQCRRFLHIRVRVRRRVSSSHVTPRHPPKFLHAFAASLIPHLSSYIHPVANVQDDSDSPTRFADAIYRAALPVVSTRCFILRRLVPRPLTRRRARVWTPWENSRAHPRAVPLFSSSSSSRRRARETPPPPIPDAASFANPGEGVADDGARAAPAGRRGHLERLLHGGLRLLNARRIRLIHSALRLLDRFLRRFEILAEPSSPRRRRVARARVVLGWRRRRGGRGNRGRYRNQPVAPGR